METPQDKLARQLVELCLEHIEKGRADASFLQLCRQVVSDSGAEYMESLASAVKLGKALPPKPNLKKLG